MRSRFIGVTLSLIAMNLSDTTPKKDLVQIVFSTKYATTVDQKIFALGNFQVLDFRAFNFCTLAKCMHASVH